MFDGIVNETYWWKVYRWGEDGTCSEWLGWDGSEICSSGSDGGRVGFVIPGSSPIWGLFSWWLRGDADSTCEGVGSGTP